MPQQDRIIATPELLARISATASASGAARVAIYGREDTISTVHFHQADDVDWRHLPIPPSSKGRPGDDQLAVTLRRNDLRLILGATIAEAHMHSREGRHATAAWAHDVAAKIADTLGDHQAAKMQRDGAAAEATRWQQLHPEPHDGATDPPRHGPY